MDQYARVQMVNLCDPKRKRKFLHLFTDDPANGIHKYSLPLDLEWAQLGTYVKIISLSRRAESMIFKRKKKCNKILQRRIFLRREEVAIQLINMRFWLLLLLGPLGLYCLNYPENILDVSE